MYEHILSIYIYIYICMHVMLYDYLVVCIHFTGLFAYDSGM